MLKKVISIALAILLLGLAGLVVREYVWPPEPAHAGATTVTSLSGNEVYINDDNITETEVAREGDIVKTGNDSWALITFYDGSTMELEPNTEVSITEITDTSISVFQEVGRTWSRFESTVGPNSEFDVETPAAAAVVRGTLIDIIVEEIGNTIAATYEGIMEVTAQDITEIIKAGMQSLIAQGQIPTEPSPIPPPKNKLDFNIDGPAWALVVDSQQRSVGIIPPGIPVTQIPGATTNGAFSIPQHIVLPVPEVAGDKKYYVVLYGKEAGDASVVATGYAEGNAVFTGTENMSVSPYQETEVDGVIVETKYVATLNVTVGADGLISGGSLEPFVLASEHEDYGLWPEKGPGKVEIKNWATEGAGEVIAPKANFSTEVADQAIRFTNLSTGDIVSYLWDFGDGTTSDDMNPSPHTYTEAGGYLVSLTVTGPEHEVEVEGSEGEEPEVEVVALEDKMLKEIYVLIVE